MQGMSERQYAAHVGLSRGAIQKAKTAERLVLFADGSIDAKASDVRRAETTDPSKTRKPPEPKLKPVPEAAVNAVGDTLREQGLAVPAAGGGTTYLQANRRIILERPSTGCRLRITKHHTDLLTELVDKDNGTACLTNDTGQLTKSL